MNKMIPKFKIMKTPALFSLAMLLFAGSVVAQVGIGTTSPHPSAILELSAIDMGLLIPRVPTDKRLGMPPVNGLMLYDTDFKKFYIYEDNTWTTISGGGDALWTRDAYNDNTYLSNTGDRVGIGLSNPTEQLQITKNFRLPMSTGSDGNIYKDANVFLHNYGTNNTFLGILSGNLTLTGSNNTANGYRAGGSLTTGNNNVMIGHQAGYYGTALTTGSDNVIIGNNAGLEAATWSNVIVIGSGAQANGKNQVRLGNNDIDEFFCMGAYNSASTLAPNVVVTSTGQIMRSIAPLPSGSGATGKVAFWSDAGTLSYNNTLHWDNVNQRLGVGASAPSAKLTVGNGTYATFVVEAPSTLTGTKNILAGTGTGRVLTSGANNSLYGHNAGYSLTTGSSNIAVGKESLYKATSATGNIAVGDSALHSATSGGRNMAIGTEALFANTTGVNNIAIGTQAMKGNTTMSGQIAIGDSTLFSNTTGVQNLAIGSNALYTNSTGFMNIAIGERALAANSTGNRNTAAGFETLESNTSGSMNAAFGSRSLEANTSGSSNAAFGFEALNDNTTGYGNTAVGAQALYKNTTGSRSVALGDSALLSSVSGHGNVAIGYKAGFHETSSDHFYVDNRYRGTAEDGRSKALMYGTFAEEPLNQRLAINGKVSIGTTAPAVSAALHVSGTDKGVIIPRLTSTQRNAIINPAEGLLIYNTTLERFEYYDGSNWKLMISTLSESGSSAEGSGYCSEGVTDYNGHHYRTVKIGNQCWMAENLKSTHYSDGTPISGAYSYNDDNSRAYKYGRLYTWSAVMNGAPSSDANPSGVQGVCPAGWHVPSDEEWKELEMTLGMTRVLADTTGWRGAGVGLMLKEIDEAVAWINTGSAVEGNNYSGFSAFGAGYRMADGNYVMFWERTNFWSCTEYSATHSWDRVLGYEQHLVARGTFNRESGASVRCVRN